MLSLELTVVQDHQFVQQQQQQSQSQHHHHHHVHGSEPPLRSSTLMSCSSVLPPVSSSAALIGYLSSSSMLEMKTLNNNNGPGDRGIMMGCGPGGSGGGIMMMGSSSGGVGGGIGPMTIGSVPSRSNMSGSVDSSDTFATCNTHPFLSQEELESNLYVNPFDNGMKDDDSSGSGGGGGKLGGNMMMMMGGSDPPVIRPTTSCGVLKDISCGGGSGSGVTSSGSMVIGACSGAGAGGPGSPWGSPTKKKRSDAGIMGMSLDESRTSRAQQPGSGGDRVVSPKTRRTRFQHAASEQVRTAFPTSSCELTNSFLKPIISILSHIYFRHPQSNTHPRSRFPFLIPHFKLPAA